MSSLSTSSHVSFVASILNSTLHYIPTTQILVCDWWEWSQKLKIMCTMPHITVKALKYKSYKRSKRRFSFSPHKHVSPPSYITRTVSISYDDVIQPHCHTCLLMSIYSSELNTYNLIKLKQCDRHIKATHMILTIMCTCHNNSLYCHIVTAGCYLFI